MTETDGLIRKRSVVIAGHRTSVSLESAFWDALRAIAERRDISIAALIAEIDRGRTGNLSSAVRIFVLGELQKRIGEAENVRAPESTA